MNRTAREAAGDAQRLGGSDAEIRRLELQHEVWRRETAALWDRAGFGPGQTLADLGCGPGWTSIDLARRVGPDGMLVAVDDQRDFIDHLDTMADERGLENITARVVDVQALDLPIHSLDGAFARWLLSFVPAPEAVIDGLSRAVRPGGVVSVQDYFNFRTEAVAPRSAVVDRVFESLALGWKANGGNPDVAGEVPSMLEAHGFEIVGIRPNLKIGRPGTPLWKWIEDVIEVSLPGLVELGLLTPSHESAFREEWSRRASDPGAFFCSPPLIDIVARRRG